MTTTRKDLYRIADAFAQSKPDTKPEAHEYRAGKLAALEQWLKDVRAVADALEVTTGFTTNGNRRFDRDRFYAACGVEAAG
jgi:hypothetical protein